MENLTENFNKAIPRHKEVTKKQGADKHKHKESSVG